MDIHEITGFRTGVERSGVNFLEPADAFQNIKNGYIYRQELQSRKGFTQFGNRLGTQQQESADGTRVMGIFENTLPDSTIELLVCTKKFLYSYDNTTNTFDQIPFNSAAPIVDFGITNNEDYVSGTTYLTKAGAQRFILTGKGMSDVYFYDGIQVKRFTNAADNPDYQAFAGGALTKATNVVWFGERLNFLIPVIAGTTYYQGMLYSGIRDSSGNGDKFNVSGSGLLSADTYEIMKGFSILGNILILSFQRSSWTIEKTNDAFNPYIVRKIPSVLGTDATFSNVAWNAEIKSIGKTGLVTTDGRTLLRFDDKIPYLTRDQIDQEQIELTYGGFDRADSQFLFSYRDDLSNLVDITQDKVLVYNYEESSWAINDQRFSVFGQSLDGFQLAWNEIEASDDHLSWGRMDTTEEIWNKIGIERETQKTLAGDNEGFIYQINVDYDDYFASISDITQAANAVLTIDETPFQVGDKVVIENAEGMTEINDITANVIAATLTSVTLDIDSSRYEAYTSNGTISKVIDFEAELVPFNPYRAEGRKCFISHIEFLLNSASGPLDVDVYMDEEQSKFKTVTLTPSASTTKAREWINMSVNQEVTFMTLVLRRESVSTQTIVSSIRIYSKPGSKESN